MYNTVQEPAPICCRKQNLLQHSFLLKSYLEMCLGLLVNILPSKCSLLELLYNFLRQSGARQRINLRAL
jgi:hypothetical protein